MRLVVDQAHLADVVARLQDREDDLAAARVGRQHAGAAGEQDEERIRLLAVLDDDLAAPEAPLDDAVGDALRLVVGQQGEQRHAPDEIEIREHRHLRSLSGCVAAMPRLPWTCDNPRAASIAIVTITSVDASRIAPHVRLAASHATHRPHIRLHDHANTARQRPDPRLRPGRLHRGGLRRARQPEADAGHRHRPGRPADDDDRRRQLAGRRRRRHGPRPDAALPASTPSASTPRSCSTTSTRSSWRSGRSRCAATRRTTPATR